MRNQTVNDKVKIFISSRIDEKFTIVRKALKLLLEETNMCEVFAFEKSNASTEEVINYYLDKIEDVDLCIFLIDNKSGVSDAVLKERNRAVELKKKSLYIFCDEQEKIETALQSEIKNGLLEKYDVVHEFSDFSQKAYASVIEDIISIYRKYCRHRLERVDNKHEIIIENSTNIKSHTEKIEVNIFGKTKKFVCELMGVMTSEKEKTSRLDEVCLPVIKWILGEGDVSSIHFNAIENEILEFHKHKKDDFIKKRLKAFEFYALGNLEKALLLLKEAYGVGVKNAEIDKWELNDVAIDIRSIEQWENSSKNIIFSPQDVGQKLIDESNEKVYYPILDRYAEIYLDSLIKYVGEYEMDSPYTSRVTNWDSIIKTAVNTFVVAFLNCSITQMICLRNRLIVFCEKLLMLFHDHNLYWFLIKLLIINRDAKKIERFARKYGESTQHISDKDVERIAVGISYTTIEYQKNISIMLLLKYYGNYFSDTEFANKCDEIVHLYKKWIAEETRLASYGPLFLDIINHNATRINISQEIGIIKGYIKYDLLRWCDEAFKTLAMIPLDQMKVENQIDFVDWFCKILNDEKYNGSRYLKQCAIYMRKLDLKNIKKLDSEIQKKWPEFYKNEYSLECFASNKQDNQKHINLYLDLMSKRNKEQGKNGVHSSYMDNPYRTIRNIIEYNKADLDDSMLLKIISIIKESLFAPEMDMQTKIEALRLTIFLAGRYSSKECLEEFWKICSSCKKEIFVCSNINMFNEFSESMLEIAFIITNNAMGRMGKEELITSFVQVLKEDDYTIINALDTISVFFNSNLHMVINYTDIYPIILFLVNSKEKDIRFHAIKILVELSKVIDSEEILKILSKMMDDEIADIKIAILTRARKISGNKKKHNIIYQKGRVDNHYLVRKVAEKCGEESV